MPITPPHNLTTAPAGAPSNHGLPRSAPPGEIVLASSPTGHVHGNPQPHGHPHAQASADGLPLHAAALDALAEWIAHKLAMRLRGPEPWLTKRELADLFRVTPAQIDRLVREGMPRLYVGTQSPRFEATACRSWLERRSAALGGPSDAGGPSMAGASSMPEPIVPPVFLGPRSTSEPGVPGVRCLSRKRKP